MSIDQKSRKFLWLAEFLLWCITIVIVIIVMSPIYMNLYSYPFTWQNVLLIVCTVTFSRWIFLLKLSPYRKSLWFHVVIAAFMPLIIFNLINIFMLFRLFIDERGVYELVKTISDMDSAVSMGKYIKTEFTFFGTSAIISAAILFFKLIVSAWRIKNSRD